MSGFRCPFCKQNMSLDSSTHSIKKITFSDYINIGIPYLELAIYKCPNDSCNEETIIAKGKNGYIENEVVLIYPDSEASSLPDYIPQAIRNDYKEAFSILFKSPKASATLSRRCLQGMIRDFWGIKKNRLIDEINELQGKIPAAQWAAIDALRQLGNIGAHMEKDVNAIVDIDDNEAEMLLQLIELLMEKWYINRHDKEQLYKKIEDANRNKKNLPIAQAQ